MTERLLPISETLPRRDRDLAQLPSWFAFFANRHPDAVEYRPRDMLFEEVTLPTHGQRLMIAMAPPPALQSPEPPRPAMALRFGSREYRVGLKARPYHRPHYIIASGELRQDEAGFEELLLVVLLARSFGRRFQLGVNLVAPSKPERWHAHLLRACCPIWTANVEKWPIRVEEFEERDPETLATCLVARLEAHARRNTRGDLLLRASEKGIRALLIPRVSRQPDGPLGDTDAYSTFGVMEVGGLYLAARSPAAFRALVSHPEWYESSLRTLSVQ